jgi:hypothetical protein
MFRHENTSVMILAQTVFVSQLNNQWQESTKKPDTLTLILPKRERHSSYKIITSVLSNDIF